MVPNLNRNTPEVRTCFISFRHWDRFFALETNCPIPVSEPIAVPSQCFAVKTPPERYQKTVTLYYCKTLKIKYISVLRGIPTPCAANSQNLARENGAGPAPSGHSFQGNAGVAIN